MFVPLSAGALQDVLIRSYTGNGANNRTIALGAAYDALLVFAADSRDAATDHLGMAYDWGGAGVGGGTAKSGAYGTLYHAAAGPDVLCPTGSNANDISAHLAGSHLHFGGLGASAHGANAAGREYVAVAFRWGRARRRDDAPDRFAIRGQYAVDYVGDGANDRELDTGDAHTLALVALRAPKSIAVQHLGFGLALGDAWLCWRHYVNYMRGDANSAAVNAVRFSGRSAVLSATGAALYGSNVAGGQYRLLALRGRAPAWRVIDFVGDGVNDRALALGGAYDLAFVIERDAALTDHLALAHAVRAAYGVFSNNGTLTRMDHRSGAAGDDYWQGFSAARDALGLGADASSPFAANVSGRLYRVLVIRFQTVNP